MNRILEKCHALCKFILTPIVLPSIINSCSASCSCPRILQRSASPDASTSSEPSAPVLASRIWVRPSELQGCLRMNSFLLIRGQRFLCRLGCQRPRHRQSLERGPVRAYLHHQSLRWGSEWTQLRAGCHGYPWHGSANKAPPSSPDPWGRITGLLVRLPSCEGTSIRLSARSPGPW